MQTDLDKDRRALSRCMLLKKDQEEWLGKIKIGLAIVKTGNTENAFLVKIPKFNIEKGTATDYDLYRKFRKKPQKTSLDPAHPEA